MSSSNETARVREVKSADPTKGVFDGQKADLYINTNKLGGKHFMVEVAQPDGRPTLIAIHL